MQNSYVGFIFGGNSAEAEVSVVTAISLEKSLRGVSVFEPVFIYISKQNKFYLVPREKMNAETFKTGDNENKSYEISILSGGVVKRVNGIFKRKLFTLDACVNCCHGGEGETGALSGFMQMIGVPFSTFSHTALGLSMDKNLFKLVLRASGVSVPNWVFITKKDWGINKSEITEKIINLKFPVIVKPNASGSSLGVNIVKNIDELADAVSIAFEFDNNIIVEKLVQNKIEFNCAVLGSTSEILVSDVDEIVEKGEMFTFNDKYIGDSSSQNTTKNGISNNSSKKSVKGMEIAKRLLPAPISDKLKNQIQETSAVVFKALGLSGISRVDFLYDKKKKKLYVGEINAVPGSMALYFFKNTKLGVFGVINKLVEIAKFEFKNKKIVSEKFIPKIF